MQRCACGKHVRDLWHQCCNGDVNGPFGTEIASSDTDKADAYYRSARLNLKPRERQAIGIVACVMRC